MTIDTTNEKIGGSAARIKGSIPEKLLAQYREKALHTIGKDVELPGFRKGKVPTDVLVSRVGEVRILEEAAKEALAEHYGGILEKHKLIAIGYPTIHITKIAPGSPVEFTLTVDLRPELALPDYKTLAKSAVKKAGENESVDPTEKEIEETIVRILESRGEDSSEEGKKKVPELTDEFVKTLGDFSSVSDFKTKLADNIKKDKTLRLQQKKRVAIVESIVSETKGDIPETLITHELERMMEQFKGDIARMGLKFPEYLSHIKKTEEDLRKEWRGDAKKRAISQIALLEIGKKEKISISKEDINKEVGHLLEHHKGADKVSAEEYVETVLMNERVLALLEGVK